MFTITLSLDEVNAILGNLGTLPYERVYPLIEKIRTQAMPQLEEINAAKAAEEAKTVEEEKETKKENKK